MDRFVLFHEPGSNTTLVIDREQLTVERVSLEVKATGDLLNPQAVSVPDQVQVSSRMFYHQSAVVPAAA